MTTEKICLHYRETYLFTLHNDKTGTNIFHGTIIAYLNNLLMIYF